MKHTIKKRAVVRDIKTIDRAGILADGIKALYVRDRENYEEEGEDVQTPEHIRTIRIPRKRKIKERGQSEADQNQESVYQKRWKKDSIVRKESGKTQEALPDKAKNPAGIATKSKYEERTAKLNARSGRWGTHMNEELLQKNNEKRRKAKQITDGSGRRTTSISNHMAGTKKTADALTKAVAFTGKGIQVLLPSGGAILFSIILIVVVCAGAMMSYDTTGNGTMPLSAEVEAYTPVIRGYAEQYGIGEYVALLKAVMMQESGGQGTDPMQASESGFNTRYAHAPNSITDADYSIQVGVQALASCLDAADVESPMDLEHIKLALQGYNFGNGYITWAIREYGGYSPANAVQFSEMMRQRLGMSRYGDTDYVPHVLRYYSYGNLFPGGGNVSLVQIALSQEGQVGGAPYWRWYGFHNRVEWCACFVSWCADQNGDIQLGKIPKFASCQMGADWFEEQGRLRSRSYIPAAGELIFFDWNGDGHTEHVGIVVDSDGGVVNTIEGNSSNAVHQRSYRIGDSRIYGYGVQ